MSVHFLDFVTRYRSHCFSPPGNGKLWPGSVNFNNKMSRQHDMNLQRRNLISNMQNQPNTTHVDCVFQHVPTTKPSGSVWERPHRSVKLDFCLKNPDLGIWVHLGSRPRLQNLHSLGHTPSPKFSTFKRCKVCVRTIQTSNSCKFHLQSGEFLQCTKNVDSGTVLTEFWRDRTLFPSAPRPEGEPEVPRSKLLAALSRKDSLTESTNGLYDKFDWKQAQSRYFSRRHTQKLSENEGIFFSHWPTHKPKWRLFWRKCDAEFVLSSKFRFRGLRAFSHESSVRVPACLGAILFALGACFCAENSQHRPSICVSTELSVFFLTGPLHLPFIYTVFNQFLAFWQLWNKNSRISLSVIQNYVNIACDWSGIWAATVVCKEKCHLPRKKWVVFVCFFLCKFCVFCAMRKKYKSVGCCRKYSWYLLRSWSWKFSSIACLMRLLRFWRWRRNRASLFVLAKFWPPPKTTWFGLVNFLCHVMFDMGWFHGWLEQNPNFASTLSFCVTHQKCPYSRTASSLVQQQVLLVPGQLCMLRANAFEVSLQRALFLGTPKSRSVEEVCFVLLGPTVILVDIRSGLWFHSHTSWHL